ncbi:MAG: amidohydrolase family protein [Planctomycetota bacterium]
MTGFASACVAVGVCCGSAAAQVAVKAETLHTMASDAIENGVVLIGADGKIERVGAGLRVPDGYEVYECAVATPGLVDVRATAGLTGLYNVDHDQDQLETSAPIQPQLRAIDAYNPREKLVAYIRSFGVTTIHTGHGPGELISGQTLIAKTRGATIRESVIDPAKGVAATLSPSAHRSGGKSPGTRAKAMEMMRAELLKAQAYAEKVAKAASGGGGDGDDDEDSSKAPDRDLKLEALAEVLSGEAPLIVMANRSQDIANALRLQEEFGFTMWLDMGAECYLHMDELKARGVPVLLHPTMYRAWGESSNLSYGTAKTLAENGVPFAISSGYEGYVPKVRVVLFEAAVAAGYGELGFERGLRSVTIDAAEILGIADRVGSIEAGKDGDIAMYDGDPFEYTTHCVGVLIEGERFGGEQEFNIGYP